MTEFLRVKSLHKSYELEKKEIKVLRGVNFTLDEGEIAVVTGRSGAGKTTFLHIVGTIESPDAGEVVIDGVRPFELGDRRLSAFRNRHIGVVFQFHYLLPDFSALENVAMPLLIGGKSKKEAFRRAEECLSLLGLEERLAHKPAELSGGEQQRVAIARAIAFSPSLLLLDEPTGNLDEYTAAAVFEEILKLKEELNLSVIFVTHHLSFVEKVKKVGKAYVLREGVLWED